MQLKSIKLVFKLCFVLCLTLVFGLCNNSLANDENHIVLNNKANSLNKDELIEHLKVLSSDRLAGRKFASESSILAQSYIVDVLTQHNVKPFQGLFRHTFTSDSLFSSKQGANIIAEVKGHTTPNHYIVLSAHYDHLGKKHGKVFNGADDNASGVSALLSIAKLLAEKPIKHSVIFLFTDAEEVNLLGGKAFIAQQQSLLSNIKINLNVDMIAGSRKTSRLNFISKNIETVLSRKAHEQLKNSKYSVPLKQGFRSGFPRGANRQNWLAASDHSVFHRAGIPFIYYGVGTHRNYHTIKDTFDNANLDFFIAAAESINQQLHFIDQHIEVKTNKKPD